MHVGTRSHGWRLSIVGGALLAGCSGALPSTPVSAPPVSTPPPSKPPLSAAPMSPSVSPAAMESIVVCPPAAKAVTSRPAEPRAWPGLNAPAGLGAAIQVETAELIAAIGNPDTGSPSPAWTAFENAVSSGDATAIRTSAETVIGHLRAACTPVAPFFDLPAAGPWAADVRGLLDGPSRSPLRRCATRRSRATIRRSPRHALACSRRSSTTSTSPSR